MSFLEQPIEFFLLSRLRTIGSISGYLTISESTTDALEITQQPVQQGAMIADHAFNKPTTFSAQLQLKPGFFSTLSELYQDLLDLQSSRVPFTVTTPKRVYKNMLFSSLGVTTDKRTENVLAVNATFQEVIIVSVVAVQAPRIAQKNPGATGATQNAGNKSMLRSTVDAAKIGFGRG